MNHRVIVKKLSKTPAHRKAMFRNMLVALFREEQIKTTVAKAKVLRRFAEKLITRSKVDSVHNRRMAAKWIQDKAVLNKLFTEIGPKFVKRPGGYTRIVKLGPRKGDASEMVYIMLVAEEVNPKTSKKKKVDKKQENSPAKTQSSAQKESDNVKDEVSKEKLEEKADKKTEENSSEDKVDVKAENSVDQEATNTADTADSTEEKNEDTVNSQGQSSSDEKSASDSTEK